MTLQWQSIYWQHMYYGCIVVSIVTFPQYIVVARQSGACYLTSDRHLVGPFRPVYQRMSQSHWQTYFHHISTLTSHIVLQRSQPISLGVKDAL